MNRHLLMNLLCAAYLVACPAVLLWAAYAISHETHQPSRLAVAKLDHIDPAE